MTKKEIIEIMKDWPDNEEIIIVKRFTDREGFDGVTYRDFDEVMSYSEVKEKDPSASIYYVR